MHVDFEVIRFDLHPGAQVLLDQSNIVVSEMTVVDGNELVDLVFKVVQVQLELDLVA